MALLKLAPCFKDHLSNPHPNKIPLRREVIVPVWGCVTVSLGRALEWHSRGQRFDPAYLHQWRKPMEASDILSGAFLFCKALLFP